MKRMFFPCLLVVALLAGGCSKSDDSLLLKNSHGLSEHVEKVSALTEGKKEWMGSDVCIPESDSDYADSAISSGYAICFNLDQPEVVYSRKPYESFNPSVLTVLLTAGIVLEKCDFTDLVTVTSEDLSGLVHAYKINLKAGDTLTVEQLLYGMVNCSGADAAKTLARYAAGSEEAFVELMNQKAKELGCVDTKFVNASGVTDNGNKSTPYDLYLILHDLMNNDEFVKVLCSKAYEGSYQDAQGNTVNVSWVSTVDYVESGQENLGDYRIVGGKTATTQACGNCLALIVEDSDANRYLALNVKAASHDRLYEQIESIVNKIGK